MAIYKDDIVDVDLNAGTIHRSFLNHSIGVGDNLVNRYGVRLFRNGSPVNVGGMNCEGFFIAPNGQSIAITSSDHTGVQDNIAWVALPQACYNYEGQFCLAIKVIGDGITGTMRIVDGVVVNTGVSGAVAPTEDVPTYQEILAVYEQMLEAKEGAIRYDITQDLSTTERDRARNNRGMVSIEFSQIEGNEYIMDVSTSCDFVNIEENEYMLVMHAD